MEILTGCVLLPCGCLLCKADLALKSNILIDNDGRARLAGLTLLTIIPDEPPIASSDSPSGTTQRVGSVQWSAPEVLEGGVPCIKSDIFSFAMVMIEARRG